MSKSLALLLLVLLVATSAAAQTVRADRVTLNAGPCVITSGSAAPNGSRVGNVCDTFIQTTSGAIWTKTSGTGTSSGWIATLAGTGTPGTLPVWTSAGAIGDSIIAQAGGVATITGSATITGTGTMNAASITTTATIGGLATMNAATITNNASIGGTATIGTEHVTGSSTIDAALAVGGNATITGNTTLGGWIGTASYASQVAGWRITSAGAADVRYLFTDELRAKLFTADQETVLAGSERITKSYSTIAQPFTCPALGAGGTLWVFDASTYGDAPVFQTNDWVLIHLLTRASFGPFTIADCVGTVSAYADGSGANAGQQSWTFTRGAGASGGAMTGGTGVPVNQLVQDMGVSGNGYVEISAVDGAAGANAPYIQTNTWTTAPVAGNTITQCRLGNLNGLGGVAQEFGLLCGSLAAQQFLLTSNKRVELRNLPVTLFDGSTPVFVLQPTPTPNFTIGNPAPSSYSAGTGIWMGKDAADSTYKFRVGNPTGNRLTWDGATLSIAGEGSGITNINGANIQAGTITGSQLTITARPGGAAINLDPNMTDSTLWVDAHFAAGPSTFVTIPDGIVGRTAMRSPTSGVSSSMWQAAYPIDLTKTYRAHLWARAVGSNGTFFFRLYPFDGNGNALATVGMFESVVLSSAWTEYHTVLRPGQIPAGTRTVTLSVFMNWNGTAGYQEVQDVRLEEAVPTTLITPGAVTTNEIAANTITAANIAANTITVGNLNATGFGDNLVKNGTFEGADPAHAIDGWQMDPASVGASTSQSCCGTRGPGTLLLNIVTAASSSFNSSEYLAVPVQAAAVGAVGATSYRVALDIYGIATTGGIYVQVLESNSTNAVRYVAILPGAADAHYDNVVYLLNNGSLGQYWNHFEFVYTPSSSSVHWASLNVQNNTCGGGTSGCQAIHLDAVEMQPQLGAGHIRAASITADRFVANTITAAQIAARTITSSQIAAGTISATEIGAGAITGDRIAARTITAGALVANTITSNEIGVRAIVAGNIATGTLTANEIASATITGDRIAAGTINANNIQAGSITADRLAVTSLSAISANLGSITAGSLNAVTVTSSTINSPTINAACTTINSNGITLTPGQSSNCNWYKWNNGAGLYHDGGAWMGVSGASFRVDTPGGAGFLIDSNFNLNANNNINLNGYVTVASGRNLTVSNLSGSGNRLVCTNNNGTLYVSAANGSC